MEGFFIKRVNVKKRINLMEKFMDFFKLNYKSELYELIERYPEKRSLVVDYELFELFDPELADLLIFKSEEVLNWAKKSLEGVDVLFKDMDVNIRFKNVSNIFDLKNVNGRHVGEFFGFYAFVQSVDDVSYFLEKSVFECTACLRLHEIEQKKGSDIVVPKICSECGGESFKLWEEESTYRDVQRLVVSQVDTSFSLDVVLSDDLCSHDDFRVGQFKLFYGTLKSFKGKDGKFNLFFDCNFVEDVECDVVEGCDEVEQSFEGRNSKEYSVWRNAVINRDGVCQCCGGYKYLEAHHIFSWEDYPLLRFDVDNGVVLCKWCHGKYNSYFGHKGLGVNLVRFLNMFGKRIME